MRTFFISPAAALAWAVVIVIAVFYGWLELAIRADLKALKRWRRLSTGVEKAVNSNEGERMRDTGEVVADIQFDESGKLAHASRAAAAIKALPPSATADKLEMLERHREQWIYKVHGQDVSATRARRLARFLMWGARDLLSILYSEIFELAHALQKEQLDRKAQAVQGEFYAEYLRMVAANRTFHAFLFEHYRERLAAAQAMNRPLLDLAKEIIAEMMAARSAEDRKYRNV